MEVYREILPQSYLLILADDAPEHPAQDEALDWALRRAVRSGKSSVWVDCTHLHHLPPDACKLLTYYYNKLNKHGMSLILCHLSEEVRQELESLSIIHPPIVATLLDAERYTQQVLQSRASA
ncbi:STAS domain-containing protein [Hymenobacter koreensis]|uniref:STAS domain-containing protein n=1 Tax=Hymenobacter koreensis TaxID=1084523 RepID=A0ABP8IX76_9BACT